MMPTGLRIRNISIFLLCKEKDGKEEGREQEEDTRHSRKKKKKKKGQIQSGCLDLKVVEIQRKQKTCRDTRPTVSSRSSRRVEV